MGDNGGPRFRDACFFLRHLLQRVLVVIFNAKRKALDVLYQQTLDVTALGAFPCAPDTDIKSQSGRGDDRNKRSHGFEKDTVSHFAASNL
jgi:hypothetical protein